MNAYDDRHLELDLREVLGLESPPDVWPVLAPRLAPTRPRLRHLRGRPPRSRTPWLVWAAAAAAVLALGVLWWTQVRRPEPSRFVAEPPPIAPAATPDTPQPVPAQPFARSEADVLIAGSSGEVRSGREVKPGERVAVGDRGTAITLRDGTKLSFPSGAWVVLREDVEGGTVELARGAMIAATGERALSIQGGPGVLVAAPRSRLRIERLERLEDERDEHAATWPGSAARVVPADVLATVQAGQVEAGSLDASPETHIVWLRGVAPRTSPRLLVEERAWLDRRVAALDTLARVDLRSPAARDADKEASQGQSDLMRRLAEKPEAWGYVVPWLERLARDLTEANAGRLALRVLVQDPELRALPAVHARLGALGLSARADELLPVAERRDDPLVRDLVRRNVRASHGLVAVDLATFLALRGDDTGAAILEEALRDPEQALRHAVRSFSAAAGLHGLGRTDAWNALRESLRLLVEEAIASGRLEIAQWPLTAAAYFAPSVRTGRPVSVLNVSRGLQTLMADLRLTSPEALRRELEKIP